MKGGPTSPAAIWNPIMNRNASAWNCCIDSCIRENRVSSKAELIWIAPSPNIPTALKIRPMSLWPPKNISIFGNAMWRFAAIISWPVPTS